MDSLGAIFKAASDERLEYITKENALYIVDKSFIEAWIEGDETKEDIKYICAFMDLLARLKKKRIAVPRIFLPIDVLMQLDEEGKTYTQNKDFIDAINTFITIKTINPDKKYKDHEAVTEMANQFSKFFINKNIVIITLDTSKYTPKKNIFPLTMNKLLLTIIFIYNLFSEELEEELKRVYDTWFFDLSKN